MTHLSPADFERLQAYLDQQLSAEERLAFEARLAREPVLADAWTAEQHLRVGLRQRLRQTRAPATLRASISPHRAAPSAKTALGTRWLAWWSTPRPVKPYLAVASLLIVFLVAVLLARLSGWDTQTVVPAEEHSVFRQLASKHAVYLQGVPLALDVRGEPAEVAAWFASRVSLPITIPSTTDWKLEGGRLGEFHHRAAVHLVYDRRGQHISLTLFTPQEIDFPAEARQRAGNLDFFRGDDGQRPVILWRRGKVGYALIGDPTVSPAELDTIALDFARQLDGK